MDHTFNKIEIDDEGNKILIVHKSQTYEINGMTLFCYQGKNNGIVRGTNIDIKKLIVPQLQHLAETLDVPKVSKMKKKELIEIVSKRVKIVDN